jgi:protein-S-isoprenylcysteine O-methyltransferase Ste14
MKWLECRIPPPALALMLAGLMWLASRWPPAWSMEPVARWAIVGGLAATGVTFDLAGLAAFYRAKTTVNPLRPQAASAFVASGVYRLTRNPMYLGLALLLAAWAAYLSSLWPLAGPFVFVLWINRFQIAPEERVMREKFGDPYRAYRVRVRRWI